MTRPRVSVVLPTFNRAATLERSARSVLGQDFRDLELLVVDDGSTDGTPALLARLAREDTRVRPLRQRNAGAAAARNAGLAAARGDLVAFQDSDDEWLPGHLSGHVAALEGSTASVAYSFMERHRDGASRLVPDPGSATLDGDLSGALLRRNLVGTPTAVARRTALEAAGPMDTRLRQLEDWDLWIRVAQRGATFVFLPQATVRSTYQPDSLSLDRPGYIDALEAILRKHASAYARHPAVLAWHADRIGLHRLLAGRTAEGRDWSLRAWQADHRRWMAGLRGSLPAPLGRRLQRVPGPPVEG